MYVYIPVCIHSLAQINLAYTYMLAIVPSSKFSLMSAKKCSASCMSLPNLHRPCISVHYIWYDWQAPSWELNLYQIDFYIVWNNGWIIHNTPPTFWTWKPLQLPCKRHCHYNWQFFFQIQVSEHNSLLCGGELHDTFSAKFYQHYHTILAINCVYASN